MHVLAFAFGIWHFGMHALPETSDVVLTPSVLDLIFGPCWLLLDGKSVVQSQKHEEICKPKAAQLTGKRYIGCLKLGRCWRCMQTCIHADMPCWNLCRAYKLLQLLSGEGKEPAWYRMGAGGSGYILWPTDRAYFGHTHSLSWMKFLLTWGLMVVNWTLLQREGEREGRHFCR